LLSGFITSYTLILMCNPILTLAKCGTVGRSPTQ
jgi:hypothetical protein